jgi:hypothetical protein
MLIMLDAENEREALRMVTSAGLEGEHELIIFFMRTRTRQSLDVGKLRKCHTSARRHLLL